MGVWGLQCSRVAWRFLEQRSEYLALCESLLEFHRIPAQLRQRFSDCPAFLTLASLLTSLPLYRWAEKQISRASHLLK